MPTPSVFPQFMRGGTGSGVITINSSGRLVMEMAQRQLEMTVQARRLTMALSAAPLLTMRLIRSN